MSVKARITLWYTAFMLLMVAAVLIFMFSVGSWQTRTASASALEAAVGDALSEIEYDDGELDIDDDIDFYSHDIYLSVYDAGGRLLAGKTPSGMPQSSLTESPDGVLTVTENGESWYVCDRSMELHGFGTVWVRGVTAVSDTGSGTGTLLRLALIALPFLALLAAVGGYLITRRALLPVKRITDTARAIGESGDLTARIDLDGGSDEIHLLAATFDGMFDRLEDTFRKEKQFTADASHELRTPTSVIISQSEYAMANPGDAEGALNVIHQQGEKMAALLSQLLLLARADRKDMRLMIETLDISELIELVSAELAPRAAEKRISVHQSLAPDCLVHGDQLMLMRLFMNLIENAVRYGREGGNIWLSSERHGDSIVCRVSDDGIGMTEEQRSRAFERFYQADPSHSGEGAGLGLAMARSIVTAHGGSIAVTSGYGRGSTFEIILPV